MHTITGITQIADVRALMPSIPAGSCVIHPTIADVKCNAANVDVRVLMKVALPGGSCGSRPNWMSGDRHGQVSLAASFVKRERADTSGRLPGSHVQLMAI
jgi:hypothetical protein